jgi:molybdenum cofactor cytidylyltransferase
MNPDESFAILILAAGASQRMGRPKQLLEVAGQPMIQIAVGAALATAAHPVIVVLGANHEETARALSPSKVHCTVNPNWREGMGASLRHGMQTLTQLAPDCAAVIVMLADQPGLGPAHLAQLVDRHRASRRPVVATDIQGLVQPPALFARQWFPRLAASSGDRGARALLQDAAAEIETVRLDALVDIDTPEDYRRFVQGQSEKAT